MARRTGADNRAVYLIRISGQFGPLVQFMLGRRPGGAHLQCASNASTVSVLSTGADIVDVAERLTARGFEIESLRTIESPST
jgi:hypothetical protein